MDAVEFIREYFRLCEAYEDCVDCPFTKEESDVPCDLISKNAEKIVSIVKQWSQDHPQKTIMQDFFEKFPNAPKTMLGYPYPCAKDLGYPKLDSCSFGIKDGAGSYCRECWSRPLED